MEKVLVDQFICEKCSTVLSSARSLQSHQDKRCCSTNKAGIKCKCNVNFSSFELFWLHLKHRHMVDLLVEETKVSSEVAFNEYKSTIEMEGRCKYVQQRGQGTRAKIVLECHRSGVHRPSTVTGQRLQKSQKSNKIGFTCPSVLIKKKDGEGFRVTYHKSHHGHSLDIGNLTLTKEERFV